jgi:ABC-type transport system involved in multi-copper enzyme maturation permease subunit
MLPTNVPTSTNTQSQAKEKLPWSEESFVPIAQRRVWINGLLGVAKYELGRSFSLSRLMGILLIVAFPVALISAVKLQLDMRTQIQPNEKFFLFSFVSYALIPQIATMLSLLLWATPAVNSELEGQTWIYALIRPNGRMVLVLGKYLVAVFWSIIAGTLAISVLVPILNLERGLELWWTIWRLLILASIAYSGLYILIGTFFQRRAMLVAFIYTVVIEGFLSFLPATINQLTVSFRLRSLMIQWLELDLPREMRNASQIFDTSGQIHLILEIVLYTVLCLGLSLFWLRRSEYSLQPEAAV